jgi:hypothetical protein
VRELVMSYFHEYFPESGKKSLYSYSDPLDLNKFKKINWMTNDDDAWKIDWALDDIKHKKIIEPTVLKKLRPASALERRVGKLTQWKKR